MTEPEQQKKSNTSLILVLGIVAVCGVGFCVVTAIIAAIAIPNLIEARKGSNEAAAIGALRTITTAQALHREADKDRNGTLDYATSLSQLGREQLIDNVLASGTKQGYMFRIESADETRWSATASPAAPGKSGDRSFFVDETGEIKYRTDGARATARDPRIGS